MREGVLPISLEELLRKAREYQHPNELTLDELRDALDQNKSRADDSAYEPKLASGFPTRWLFLHLCLSGSRWR
jgi:hypothetical protein